MHKTYTLLIEYLYTNQILLSNSSNTSLKCFLEFFFLPFFLNSLDLIKVCFFTPLQFLILLGNLFQKYFTLLAQKSSWLVGLVLEIIQLFQQFFHWLKHLWCVALPVYFF